MVLITNNRRMWIVGMAVSLAIFGLLYLTVIKPSSDTANQAVKTGLQQSQQAISQAQKQLSNLSGQAGTVAGTGGQAGTVAGADGQAATVASQATQQLGKAAKLTSCVAAAGADAGAVQACQTKYGE